MNRYSLIILAAGLLGFSSCVGEKPVADYFTDQKSIHIKPVIEGEQLQTGDLISVSCEDGSMVFRLTESGEWTPTDKKYLVWYEGKMPDYFAFHPTTEGISEATFSLPQIQNKIDRLRAADYMVGAVMSPTPKSGNVMELPMLRRTAKVKITVSGIDNGTQVQGFKIYSYPGYSEGAVVTNKLIGLTPYPETPEGKRVGENGTVYTALVVPGPKNDGTVFFSMYYENNSISVKGFPEFEAGKEYAYSANIKEGIISLSDPVISDWTAGTITGGVATMVKVHVKPTGTGSRNGKDWDNAYGLAELSSLLTSSISTLNGQTILFSNDSFDFSGYGDGIELSANSATNIEMVGSGSTVFNGGDAARFFKFGANVNVTASNITFSHGCNSTVGGGALLVNAGKHNFENCIFANCSSGTQRGGAIYANAAGSEMTFKKCEFNDNTANNDNDGDGGGAMFIGEIKINFDSCTFAGNLGGRGSAILFAGAGASCLLKANACKFIDNVGYSRGTIQTNAKGAALFNNCLFKGNRMKTNAWGRVIHAGYPAICCMNNCTICDNPSDVDGGNSVCLNGNGSFIIVNTTVVDSNAKTLMRFWLENSEAATAVTSHIENCLLFNKHSCGNVLTSGTTKMTVNTYNNAYGPTAIPSMTYWTGHNDLQISSGPGNYDEEKGLYIWNGTLTGFTPTTASNIRTHLNAITVNNGNTKINGAFCPYFVSWLDSMGALDVDARGVTRTGTMWPGSYQNN